ncbi:unnamed protein product, partial [Nesidiocoris tenuis]
MCFTMNCRRCRARRRAGATEERRRAGRRSSGSTCVSGRECGSWPETAAVTRGQRKYSIFTRKFSMRCQHRPQPFHPFTRAARRWLHARLVLTTSLAARLRAALPAGAPFFVCVRRFPTSADRRSIPAHPATDS